MRRFVLVCLLATSAVATPHALTAQRARGNRLPPGERMRPQERAQLEQRFRERLAVVVQQQVGLNDEQMRRLSEVNQRYETKRLELVRRERETRIAMRRELMENASPNEDRVAQLLQESTRIQRERLDLVEAEQADLGKFLTPSQRARYLGIQEQMRRRIEELRDRPPFVDEQGRGAGRRPAGTPGIRRRPPPN